MYVLSLWNSLPHSVCKFSTIWCHVMLFQMHVIRSPVLSCYSTLTCIDRYLHRRPFCLLLLRLRSSRVIDTLGHTSTPIFSVGCRYFSLFTGHTNGLQIVLAYGTNPVFSSVFLVCAWCGGPFANTWLALVFSYPPCIVYYHCLLLLTIIYYLLSLFYYRAMLAQSAVMRQ